MNLLISLIFLVSLTIFSLFLIKSTWVRSSGLNRMELTILWPVKAIAGLTIVWIHGRFYPENDYYGLNQLGLIENNGLRHQPHQFFTDWMFSPYAHKYGQFFQSTGSYWNDLRNTLLSKGLAFLDFITQGNIWFNTLFFSFFSMMGCLGLYRVFLSLFPGKKIPVLIGCFLLPSSLLFSSGLHKDAIVFGVLGLFFYAFYFGLMDAWNRKRVILLICSLILLFLFRNYILVILLPVSLLWYVVVKKKINAYAMLGMAMLLLLVYLILADIYFPDKSPINILAHKQAEYLDLPHTQSALPIQKLQPTLKSTINCLPNAIEHVFLKPLLWDEGGALFFISAAEVFIYQLLFVLLMFLHHRSSQTISPPSMLFILIIATSLLLFVGYISPNAGTLVRYRSQYLPLVITPVLCCINWKRFRL